MGFNVEMNQNLKLFRDFSENQDCDAETKIKNFMKVSIGKFTRSKMFHDSASDGKIQFISCGEEFGNHCLSKVIPLLGFRRPS